VRQVYIDCFVRVRGFGDLTALLGFEVVVLVAPSRVSQRLQIQGPSPFGKVRGKMTE
jgi:hypothetical protein